MVSGTLWATVFTKCLEKLNKELIFKNFLNAKQI